jgi:integrase
MSDCVLIPLQNVGVLALTREEFESALAPRRRDDDVTKTESSVRTVPIPSYLIHDLKQWKLQCPPTAMGMVFPGQPDEHDFRGPIDADKLLRNILRRALRRAGLPPLRFHDIRHLAGTLMCRKPACRRRGRRKSWAMPMSVRPSRSTRTP